MALRLPLEARDLPGSLPSLGNLKQSKSLGAKHKAPCLHGCALELPLRQYHTAVPELCPFYLLGNFYSLQFNKVEAKGRLAQSIILTRKG